MSALSTADAEELAITADANPLDRSGDRLLAHLGLLNDALPQFAPGQRLPCVGVLLALPAITQSGVIDCARDVYGCIGPAFFGLRKSVVALVLMALLRIRRPENLKEHPPADLGRALARHRVSTHGNALGFVYVDGHVRVYHGIHDVSKTHIARMRIAMPGVTDYWVNDAHGEPLFVVTGEANTGLCKALPGILGEIRTLIGERRTTVVFGRGGWSPALFARLIADGFDILTYRKGRCPRVPAKRFTGHEAELDGRKVSYLLADYAVEDDDPDRDVPNPHWAHLRRSLAGYRRRVLGARSSLASDTHSAIGRPRPAQPQSDVRFPRTSPRQQDTFAPRAAEDPRTLLCSSQGWIKPERSAQGESALTSVIKTMAYQVEGELVRLLSPHYNRAEHEGRTLIQNALASAADIDVTDAELRITLAPLSSAHRTRALAALCEQLDATKPVFPGTHLRLRYAVAAPR